MSMIHEILNQALTLPKPERAVLVHQLLLSLEPEDFDEDSEAAWTAEIEARLTAVEKGEFTAVEWRDALARIQQALTQRQSP